MAGVVWRGGVRGPALGVTNGLLVAGATSSVEEEEEEDDQNATTASASGRISASSSVRRRTPLVKAMAVAGVWAQEEGHPNPVSEDMVVLDGAGGGQLRLLC